MPAAQSSQAHHTVVESPLGWFAIAGSRGIVTDIVIGHAERSAALAELNEEKRFETPGVRLDVDQEILAERLLHYFSGEPISFLDLSFDCTDLPPFTAKVVRRLTRLDYGRTATYGSLAAEAGSPQAARAVGNVMRLNRLPIVLPCHRVLASDGRLGGFSGFGGTSLKKRLLELESSGNPDLPRLFSTPR
ncbi:methylated-DNA--[protein]-cysteine S-methyltransferase [Stratiformator vulcanicus]|uniref:Methylated-DNA--protein-cysteine methyltransferase n=1 Tax=Stratiformator vulcanicus TaxID=2527980 RepID=A0A517R0Q1_9PLAN|nr:methylated-DNA--[protein]-cysteine S-methyltransferase [Stratiformator vulcanicus]QDT37414.1 Methylated-DNA--protein-cysteine methyltransferase, constitutive [Stratiformator vulcanicus]